MKLIVALYFYCLVLTAVVQAASSNSLPYTTYTNVAYGTDIHNQMDIYVPNTAKLKPLIILIHGGGWVSGDKSELTQVAQFFASNGCVVANINYRFATLVKNQYPTAENDTQTATVWLKAMAWQYQINANKVAVLGTSVGAYFAVQLGEASLVQAVVDFYGPVDLTDPTLLNDSYVGKPDSFYISTFLGASLAQNQPLYVRASPINFVSVATPPTFIFHGQEDNTVPMTQSETLNNKLRSLGVHTNLVLVPNQGHGFLTSQPNSIWLNDCLVMLKPIFTP